MINHHRHEAKRTQLSILNNAIGKNSQEIKLSHSNNENYPILTTKKTFISFFFGMQQQQLLLYPTKFHECLLDDDTCTVLTLSAYHNIQHVANTQQCSLQLRLRRLLSIRLRSTKRSRIAKIFYRLQKLVHVVL